MVVLECGACYRRQLDVAKWLDRLRTPAAFTFTLLLIEFLDGLSFGAGQTAWPLIRDDLALSYAQIGFVISASKIVSGLVETPLGILADVWKRRAIVLTGGVLFALSCLLTAVSHSFLPLLIAFGLFNSAYSAFVTMSEATLMDTIPSRRDQNMARWALAGSIGFVAGPLLLGGLLVVDLGWRSMYHIFAALALLLVAGLWLHRFPGGIRASDETGNRHIGFVQGVRNALSALRRVEVARWLILLQFAYLMLDVLINFLALYLVDIGGFTPQQAGLTVAVWSGVGLLGDAALIPVLERVEGVRYLRVSAVLEMLAFVLFLLMPGYWPKLILLGLLGFFNSGWYAVLRGRLYASMPGQSGAVTTVSNLFGLVGHLIPLGLGLIAARYGLRVTMWLLLAGPITLLIGLPRRRSETETRRDFRGNN